MSLPPHPLDRRRLNVFCHHPHPIKQTLPPPPLQIYNTTANPTHTYNRLMFFFFFAFFLSSPLPFFLFPVVALPTAVVIGAGAAAVSGLVSVASGDTPSLPGAVGDATEEDCRAWTDAIRRARRAY